MITLGFVVFLLARSATGAFFDLADVEDPLTLIWHAKDTPNERRPRRCLAIVNDGSVATGQCRQKHECLLAGGRIYFNYGSCGFLSTCCIQQTCSQVTHAKVAHFSSDVFNPNLTHCTYTVEAQNDNICQMRIDFENFELSPPVERLAGPNPGTVDSSQPYQRVCSTDYLEISPNTYNIPILCGSNNNQHVYVHLYSQRQVSLYLHLENRMLTTNTQAISNPHWKIRITQLECPGPKKFFTKYTGFNLDEDFKLLAPAGAIQYFLAPSGRIRSFGFNGTTSEYISGLNYSVAFRRTPNVNCIKFSQNFIRLRTNISHEVDTPGYCLDYLFVPGLRTDLTEKYGSQLCSRAVGSQELFYSIVPGPFYVSFTSQATYTRAPALENLVHAFDIHYELTSCI